MSLDQTRANQILDAIHAVTPLTASTAPTKLRLMTANGTSTANGTELTTGGGYTSGTGAPTVAWTAAAAGSQPSSGAVSVANMPASTVVGVEVWDSAGTPKRQEFGALAASKTLASGDTLSFAAGAITSSLA
jgi:hypothetical protein